MLYMHLMCGKVLSMSSSVRHANDAYKRKEIDHMTEGYYYYRDGLTGVAAGVAAGVALSRELSARPCHGQPAA